MHRQERKSILLSLADLVGVIIFLMKVETTRFQVNLFFPQIPENFFGFVTWLHCLAKLSGCKILDVEGEV